MANSRFDRVMQTLDLAVQLQSKRLGMSTREISAYMNQDIRTIQRLMQSMEYHFPQMVVHIADSGEKRFHIPNGTFDRLIGFSLDELTALETAAQKIDLTGFEDDAKLVRSAIKKIHGLMRPEDRNRVDVDLEYVLQAEGLIASPGPRRAIPMEHIVTLRNAIKGGTVCDVSYIKQDGTERHEKLHPYGFLYGHRHYLVAKNPARKNNPRKIIMSTISEVQLTDELFEVDEDFDLQEFSNMSFGVFFDRLYQVEWVFDVEASSVARDYIFHPNQKFTDNADGTLTVKFEASGLQEMAWHLTDWGNHVTVLAPPELREIMDARQIQWDNIP